MQPGYQTLNSKKKKLSDSGVILCSEETNNNLTAGPIRCFIHEAILLIRLNPSRLQKNSQDLFINALKFPIYNIHVAPMNLKNYNISEFCSTRKARITDTSGYNSQKREIQASQLYKS